MFAWKTVLVGREMSDLPASLNDIPRAHPFQDWSDIFRMSEIGVILLVGLISDVQPLSLMSKSFRTPAIFTPQNNIRRTGTMSDRLGAGAFQHGQPPLHLVKQRIDYNNPKEGPVLLDFIG